MPELFVRHVALPADHGSWFFLLSPLAIGLFAGGRWTVVSTYLVVACLAAFLVRQPITIVVKILSGRRARTDLAAALVWTALYGSVGLVHLAGLVLRGFSYLLYLALAGFVVFGWYLYLVSRRAERRQLPVEILATGVLAASAAAGYWIGTGRPDPLGWLLWALTWAHSTAAIVYAYLRLEQRSMERVPDLAERFRMGRPALLLATGNTLLVALLGQAGIVSVWLAAAYLVPLATTLRGVLVPAIGARPREIGYRLLAAGVLFTVVFIAVWGTGPAG